MSLKVDPEKVEKVVHALVQAVSDDPSKLHTLLSVLHAEGPDTGLGYIVSDATKFIQQKVVTNFKKSHVSS